MQNIYGQGRTQDFSRGGGFNLPLVFALVYCAIWLFIFFFSIAVNLSLCFIFGIIMWSLPLLFVSPLRLKKRDKYTVHITIQLWKIFLSIYLTIFLFLEDVEKEAVNEKWRKGEEAWLDVWNKEREKQEDEASILNAQFQVK